MAVEWDRTDPGKCGGVNGWYPVCIGVNSGAFIVRRGNQYVIRKWANDDCEGRSVDITQPMTFAGAKAAYLIMFQ